MINARGRRVGTPSERKKVVLRKFYYLPLSLDFRVTDDNNDDDDVGMEDGGLADDENREEK